MNCCTAPFSPYERVPSMIITIPYHTLLNNCAMSECGIRFVLTAKGSKGLTKELGSQVSASLKKMVRRCVLHVKSEG